MSDRHLRRLGQDYGSAFLTLLPQGQAWPKYPGTTLDLACRGLAEYWGFVDSRAADLLERESDPRQTVELLPDWERAFGLPDPCVTEPLTIADRQIALVLKMTSKGGQSREYFIEVAARLGYTITIREYSPFMAGVSEAGDTRDKTGHYRWEIGPAEMRFYWTINVGAVRLSWFRAASGQAGVDPHLRIALANDLECLIERYKPAHSDVIFDYTLWTTTLMADQNTEPFTTADDEPYTLNLGA